MRREKMKKVKKKSIHFEIHSCLCIAFISSFIIEHAEIRLNVHVFKRHIIDLRELFDNHHFDGTSTRSQFFFPSGPGIFMPIYLFVPFTRILTRMHTLPHYIQCIICITLLLLILLRSFYRISHRFTFLQTANVR
uniref:Uncharacterized protein n=1 Tax=Sipha flava TaxID=143950 RepID=A0A2S2PYR6_9HEMI